MPCTNHSAFGFLEARLYHFSVGGDNFRCNDGVAGGPERSHGNAHTAVQHKAKACHGRHSEGHRQLVKARLLINVAQQSATCMPGKAPHVGPQVPCHSGHMQRRFSNIASLMPTIMPACIVELW